MLKAEVKSHYWSSIHQGAESISRGNANPKTVSWVVVALIQYINCCHSEHVHLTTNFKRGWQEKWVVRKQLSLSFFVGFVWYGEGETDQLLSLFLTYYMIHIFQHAVCTTRDSKGLLLLSSLRNIVCHCMRSINWTSRRSQGYPLLAAGLRIPTRRKMSHEIILVLAKKKPVRVCIRSFYREYPPLKPKI